ncbi:hypothetical protein BY457_103152 [Marinilabilia salmonicolor]|jgi:hypothetical protein|uniref:hypothetical protein n=1 Tax=Marinilabilia salmonicolor TaxID=989 RepID=UPI000D059F9E|nr:hypothetical protein [Marinilabilia salmonicolor]PRZ01337.1 hypothetical protein BY457_103152 [Marinilabilia salmonicolor]
MKNLKPIFPVFIFFLLVSCNYNAETESPLVGEWSFIEGFSNGKPNFIDEEHRTKVFNSNGTFYISHCENGNENIEFKGKFETVDGNHFKEILNRSTSVIYEYEIKNDTLTFEGELKIPMENGSYRTVLVKEKWAKR